MAWYQFNLQNLREITPTINFSTLTLCFITLLQITLILNSESFLNTQRKTHTLTNAQAHLPLCSATYATANTNSYSVIRAVESSFQGLQKTIENVFQFSHKKIERSIQEPCFQSTVERYFKRLQRTVENTVQYSKSTFENSLQCFREKIERSIQRPNSQSTDQRYLKRFQITAENTVQYFKSTVENSFQFFKEKIENTVKYFKRTVLESLPSL